MNKKFSKAYLLCEAEHDRTLSIVTGKRSRISVRDDHRLIVKECKDIGCALVNLEIAIGKNGGKLNLITSRKYNVSEKEHKLRVEYRLHTGNKAKSGQSLAEFLCYSHGSHIDMLIIDCEDLAKCIVRCDEFIVYVTNDISAAEIQNSETFIRNLEHSEFREQHGIFCIAETYSPIPGFDDYGIVFLDLPKMKSSLEKGSTPR